MLSLPATTNATPSLQATLSRSRAEQSRRRADQLEAQAQNLRSQADQTEASVQSPQTNVRAPAAQSDLESQTPPQKPKDDDATYSIAVLRNTADLPVKTQDFLVRMYSATGPQFAASGNALKSNPNAPAVVNTMGQKTGRIVNILA